MGELKIINNDFENDRTSLISKITLMEENMRLKDEIVKLKN